MPDQEVLQAFTTYVTDRVLSDSLIEYSTPVAKMTITIVRNNYGGYNTVVKAKFIPRPSITLEADDSNSNTSIS